MPQVISHLDQISRLRGERLRVNASTEGETLTVGGGVQLGVRRATPLVTFVMDDGYLKDYTEAFPIFANAGEVACCALISDFIETGNKMSIAQALELQNDHGWEILSHTKTHQNLGSVTDVPTLETELGDSKAALVEMGFDIRNLVYPFNASNDTVTSIARKYYRSATGNAGSTVTQNVQPIPSYTIHRFDLDNASLATAKAAVDSAISNNAWLNIMLHTNLAGGDWDTVKTWLPDLLTYIQGLSVPIVTVNQALDRFGNLLDVGTRASGLRVGGEGQLEFIGQPILNTTITVNPGTVSANSTKDAIYTGYTGIKTSDAVICHPQSVLESGLVFQAWVSQSGGVRVRVANVTGSDISASPRTWRLMVLRTGFN